MDRVCSHLKQEFLCHSKSCSAPQALLCSECMLAHHNANCQDFISIEDIKKLIEHKFTDKTRLFSYNIDFQLSFNIDQLFDTLLKIVENNLNDIKIQIKKDLLLHESESLVPNLINLTFNKSQNLVPKEVDRILKVSNMKMAELLIHNDNRISQVQELVLPKLKQFFVNLIPENQKDLSQFTIYNQQIKDFDEKYNYDSILQKSKNIFQLPHYLKYQNGEQYYGQTLLGMLPDGYGQLFMQRCFHQQLEIESPCLISAIFEKGTPTIGIKTYLNKKEQVEFAIVEMQDEFMSNKQDSKQKGCFIQ